MVLSGQSKPLKSDFELDSIKFDDANEQELRF